MTENANVTPFNPSDHLVQIKTQDGLKPYLDPRKATTWFYHDNPPPSGKIITNVIRFEPTIVVRAEIWIGGEIVATGHADSEGKSNTLKKIESSAIRRALANAGYGTDQVIARFSRTIPVADSKAMLGSGKANGERRMGVTPSPDVDTRNPIAKLAAGLEINGTTLELAATSLRIKDLNDIDEWRIYGTTPKEIAEQARKVAKGSPYARASV